MNDIRHAGGSRRHLSNEPKNESVETKWEHLQYYESRLEVSRRERVRLGGPLVNRDSPPINQALGNGP